MIKLVDLDDLELESDEEDPDELNRKFNHLQKLIEAKKQR